MVAMRMRRPEGISWSRIVDEELDAFVKGVRV